MENRERLVRTVIMKPEDIKQEALHEGEDIVRTVVMKPEDIKQEPLHEGEDMVRTMIMEPENIKQEKIEGELVEPAINRQTEIKQEPVEQGETIFTLAQEELTIKHEIFEPDLIKKECLPLKEAAVNMCTGCSIDEWAVISKYFNCDTASIECFQRHGILPANRYCDDCSRLMTLEHHNGKYLFKCDGWTSVVCQKRIRLCEGHSIDVGETWLQKAPHKPCDMLLFINAYVRVPYVQEIIVDNLHWSSKDVAAMEVLCGDVVMEWMEQQPAIGGPGVVVEVAEFKSSRGVEFCIWIFGGLERETKKKFFIPLLTKPNPDTVASLIQKYIKIASVIHSDKHYPKLDNLGYKQPTRDTDAAVHTEGIRNMWLRVKKCSVPRPGSSEDIMQHFARRLFLLVQNDYFKIFHKFLKEVTRCHPFTIISGDDASDPSSCPQRPAADTT